MKTYKDLKEALVKIGFKPVRSLKGTSLLCVGYGHNSNPNPRYCLEVFRTQEQAGGKIYFQDWLIVTGGQPVKISTLEEVWAAGMKLAEIALQPQPATI